MLKDNFEQNQNFVSVVQTLLSSTKTDKSYVFIQNQFSASIQDATFLNLLVFWKTLNLYYR